MKKTCLSVVASIALLAACTQQSNAPASESTDTTNTTNVNATETTAVETPQMELKDYGAEPTVFNLEEMTVRNENYRTAVWTGQFMQMTLMSLQPGEDIGLELHTKTDQFLRVEEGKGTVYMGDAEDNLDFVQELPEDHAVIIPAGKWHNLVNTGDKPLKLYSIYAPVEHPHGTVHATRAEGLDHDHDH